MKCLIQQSPDGTIFYFFNDRNYYFSFRIRGDEKIGIETANKYSNWKDDVTGKFMKSLYVNSIAKSGNPKEIEFFIHKYLASEYYDRDAYVGIKEFSCQPRDCRILTYILHCSSLNFKSTYAEIDNSQGDINFAILNIFKSPSTLQKILGATHGKHEISMPINQIESYLASSFSVYIRLKNNTYLLYGDTSTEICDNYQKYLDAYAYDWTNIK